jgi:pyrroline-5-carboxylate reductase
VPPLVAPKLVVVGGGRMGEALVEGLLAAGWCAPSELLVVEKLSERRAELGRRLPAVEVSAAPRPADAALLAVKPGDAEAACAALAPLGLPRLLSIVAGVDTARLEAWLGPATRVVRAMPNTAATVRAAASALAAGASATSEDLDWAQGVLEAVGRVVRLPECLLDAATGLSGSGPAYVFLVVEALIEAGVLVGLPRQASETLAVQTLVGAGRLLADSGESPEALRKAVTSPGGTTAAGLAVLEAHGVRGALLEAVRAATARAAELAG